MALTDVIALAPPWLFGEGVGVVKRFFSASKDVTAEARRALFHLTVLFIAAGVLLALFRYLWRRIAFDTSRYIEYDLRETFFNHLLKLSPSFYDDARIGDLISRASYDIEMIRMFLSIGLIIVVDVATIELTTLPLLFYLNAKLALIVLIPLPFMALLATKMIRRLARDSRRVQDFAAKLSARVQENYSGAAVVKAFGREDAVADGFEKLSRENVEVNVRFAKSRGMFMAAVMSAAIMSQLVFLLFGGREVISGALPLKDFVKFNFYLLWIVWPMAYLGWGINLYQRGLVSMERLKEILDTEPEITDGPEADPSITSLKGDIEMRDLTFAYDGKPVLQGVNLRIKAGETVAIVGRTGSGKTTLVSLIPRLYNPPRNTVFIDGREIYAIPLHTLRKHIGFVTQEPLLFSLTIGENIAFGVDVAADGGRRVEQAARDAGIHAEIEAFPDRYATKLGERGVNISGGQKQRATIARALAADPPILILDDALSSVDTSTEEEILSNLRRIRKGRTCIIISHRVSTVKDADSIVVLEKGRVAEKGTHAELIARRGYYYELYRSQELRRELDDESA